MPGVVDPWLLVVWADALLGRGAHECNLTAVRILAIAEAIVNGLGYLFYYKGLLGPGVLVIALALLVVMWKARILTNRTYLILEYLVSWTYFVHVQHVLFVSGWSDGLPPISTSTSPSLRIAIITVGLGILLWAGWQWARNLDSRGQLDEPRGLQYLRERRRRD